ncbi:CD225/dispanin family protein [Lachnoclostridium sp. An169]|uniref:CD225/dispanin family protein n=1 Tax=Lachnoclostridium sp. An169 TaxID=1965569 RepID=UPI001FA8B68C|nr:CD225/dispanin family protein [Lachnoclostridium sp. An169]
MEMRCINCYQEIPDGSKFCPHCGAQQPVSGNQAGTDTYQNTQYSDADSGQQNAQYSDPDGARYSGQQNAQYSDPNGAQYSGQQNTQYNTQNSTQYQYAQYNHEEPVNWIPYLILSIISTVCCCIPVGIVAIFYTVKINTAVSSGDAESARHAANMAKIWIIVAVVVGIVVDLIAYFVFGMIGEIGYYYYY